MSKQIVIHYFQTEDEEWLCAVQEPDVHECKAMGAELSTLSREGPVAEEGEEHLKVLARIAIHHAMRKLGEPEREFKLEFLPPVVRMEAPEKGIGASILDIFQGVTVWRQAD